MPTHLEKPIYCRKCKRFLFSTILTQGEAECPKCGVVTGIKEARKT